VSVISHTIDHRWRCDWSGPNLRLYVGSLLTHTICCQVVCLNVCHKQEQQNRFVPKYSDKPRHCFRNKDFRKWFM